MPEKRMRMIKKEEPGAGCAQRRRQRQQHSAAAEERRFRGDKTDALICRRQSESHVDSQLRSTAPSAASPSSTSPANGRGPKRALANMVRLMYYTPTSPYYIGPPPPSLSQPTIPRIFVPYREKIGRNWTHIKKKKSKKSPSALENFSCDSPHRLVIYYRR